MEGKIGIEGLAQLNRGLRSISKGAPKALRLVHNDAASLLISTAKRKVPSATGAAQRSMVARSTRTSARVAVGGKRAPYFPWLDFGGEGRVKGRPAPREFIKSGRYVYPTLAEIRPKIEGLLQDGLDQVIRDAGLKAD